MDVLVSFCNQWTPGLPALGLLNTETSAFRIVRLPPQVPRCAGVRGVTVDSHFLYAALQEGPLDPPTLLVLDRRDLSLRHRHAFETTGDIHSLWISGQTLWAVSTGTDEVFEVQLDCPRVLAEGVVWRPDPEGPRADCHHLNAVCGWKGELLVSGFGKKAGALWSTAREGFIVNITRGDCLASGVNHPHSVVEVDGTIAYCESSRKRLCLLGGPCIGPLPGYARGLCQVGRQIFVGTSHRRPVSRSTGLPLKPEDPDGPGARCAVSKVSLSTLRVEDTIDLSPYGEEIYDLLPVEATSEWPILPAEHFPGLEGAWEQQLGRAVEEVAAVVPPEAPFILADGEAWGLDAELAGRPRLPLTERGGQYWGPPADDAEAIGECQRLHRAGARYLVVAWPAFWWLGHYAGWHRHLRAHARCLMENERLLAFDLGP
jgi:hypothetical protein